MNKLTASPDFIIRSPKTAEEIEHYFRLNAETFRPDQEAVLVASRWQRFIENDPDFHYNTYEVLFMERPKWEAIACMNAGCVLIRVDFVWGV